MSVHSTICDRTDEINLLQGKFSSSGAVVIVGMGGMGKTSLAKAAIIKFCEQEPYKERSFTVKCRPGWKTEDLFYHIRKAFEYTFGRKINKDKLNMEGILAEAEECSAVILIDDFQVIENEETLNLVSKARKLKQSRMIVCSRKKPDLEPVTALDIYHHELWGMSRKESDCMANSLISFLEKETLDEATLASMYDLTKGHPFTLKILTGLLASGRVTLDEFSWDSGSVSEELGKHLIGLWWSELSENIRQMLTFLSMVRIPVQPEAVLDPGPDSQSGINLLLDHCLLEHDEEGRIWVHDIVKSQVKAETSHELIEVLHASIAKKLHAAAGNDPEILSEAYYHYVLSNNMEKAEFTLISMAELFIALLGDARHYTLVFKNGVEKHGFRNDNLYFAIAKAYIQNHDTEEAQKWIKLVSGWKKEFLKSIESLYLSDQDSEIAFLERAASMCPDAQERVFLKLRIAMAWAKTKNISECQKFVLDLEKEINFDDFSIVKALYYEMLGRLEYYQHQYQPALEKCSLAEKLYRKIGNYQLAGTMLHVQGIIRSEQGDLVGAEKLFLKRLESSIDSERVNIQAGVYNSLGFLKMKMNEHEQAHEYFRKAIEKGHLAQNVNRLAFYYGNAGWACNCFDPEKGRSYFERALVFCEKAGNRTNRLKTLNNYVQNLILSGDITKANEYLAEVMSEESDNLTVSGFSTSLALLVSKICGNKKKQEELQAQYMAIVMKFPPDKQDAILRDDKEFEQKIMNRLQTVKILTNNEVLTWQETEQAEKMEKEKDKFEIFANLASGKLYSFGKETAINKHKKLWDVIQIFLLDPTAVLTLRQIYDRVWNREFNGMSDQKSFRATLTRVRKLLGETDDKRVILQEEKGSYRFNNDLKYCIIIPSFIGLPKNPK